MNELEVLKYSHMSHIDEIEKHVNILRAEIPSLTDKNLILENKFHDCLSENLSIEEKDFQVEKDLKISKDTIDKFSKSTKCGR